MSLTLATAITVGSVATAGAAIYSSNKASKSADKAIEAQSEAIDQSTQLSRDQFDWFKGEYARTQPGRDRAEATAQNVADTQLTLMRDAQEQFRDQAEYAKTFRPLEQKLVQQAQEYDTPERRAAESGRAMASVQQQADMQAGVQARRDMSMGVNPSDRKFLANQNGIRVALGKAYAGDQARRNVEQVGVARMMDAAGLGRGVVGNQATFLSAANQSGNSATGSMMSGLNAQMSGAPLMQTGFNSAINGLNNAANTYGGMARMYDGRANSAIQGFGNFMQGLGSMGFKPFGG